MPKIAYRETRFNAASLAKPTCRHRLVDIAADFRAAAARAGVAFESEIVPDGRIHRAHVAGDAEGSRNGWYVLHADAHPRGRFGSWKLSIAESWRAGVPLTEAERAQIAAAQAARRGDMAARAARARARAVYLWDTADAASPAHPYLVRKQVGVHSLRARGDWLLIPLFDTDSVLHSIQFIGADGTKKFLRDGRVTGCFAALKPGEVWPAALYRIYLAEGFATAATVQEATAETAVVAFNAGNLGPVAAALRARMPDVDIIVCADNDAWVTGNPGVTKAREAALLVRGRLAIPRFRDTATRPTDFNDLFRLEGSASVNAQLRAARFAV